MALLGHGLLALALAVALYGAGASIAAARIAATDGPRGAAWQRSGRRAAYALAALLTASFLLLEVLFVRTDLRFEVVADHSSATTPLLYRIAAPWSSQEGSLLLWAWFLSLWTALILWRLGRRMSDVVPWAQAVLLALAGAFLAMLTFLTPPFTTLDQVPIAGVGLSPLLQYPSMMIHPPMLYGGYTLFAVPFAFAVGALIAGRVGAEWIQATRRFALGAWLLLGIGLVLGARWSYAELGWGGYWGWDAVENAGLMPWVLGTAFLHSVMIQEKRGMLRTWNVSLILGVGVLCVLGTFIVRSGVLSSIHAFGASTLGIPFLLLLVVMAGGSIALVTWRRDVLRSEHRIDSLLSREAFFLAGNVVLVALVVVILWGTFFPLIGELITGQQRPLETVWWGRFVGPLALIVTLLMGLGPLAAWRRTTAAHAWRQVRGPLAVVVVAVVAAGILGGLARVDVAIAVVAGGFVLGAVGQELQRGARARRGASGEPLPLALVRQVARNRRRYGGYLVHAGIAVLVIAVAASSGFKEQRRIHAEVGDRFSVGGYDLRYEKAIGDWETSRDGGSEQLRKIILGARVGVYRDGRRIETIEPTREYYPSTDTSLGPVSRFFLGEAATEVALDTGATRDLWVAMAPDGDALAAVLTAIDKRLEKTEAPFANSAQAAVNVAAFYRARPSAITFQVIVAPGVTWIWIGSLLALLGGLLAIWPAADAQTRRVRAGYRARVVRDLGRAPAGD
jgi:cytochrome c-type biogenesis protein CcmF